MPAVHSGGVRFSRKALAHRVAITMEADFCVEEASARYGKPEILNTDQGSQFTSLALTSMLRRENIAIRMDMRAGSSSNWPMS
jgi:putative transposase